MRMMKWALALAGVTAMASPAFAEVVARAASPDGKLTVAVSLDNEGRPSYSVAKDGKAVLNDSKLGFLFTDAPKIERGLTLAGTKRDRSDTSWTQPFGEWKTIRDNHTELTVTFREAKNLKREMAVEL